jgi:hypothetical protein
MILLLLPPECWDDRCVPPYQTGTLFSWPLAGIHWALPLHIWVCLPPGPQYLGPKSLSKLKHLPELFWNPVSNGTLNVAMKTTSPHGKDGQCVLCTAHSLPLWTNIFDVLIICSSRIKYPEFQVLLNAQVQSLQSYKLLLTNKLISLWQNGRGSTQVLFQPKECIAKAVNENVALYNTAGSSLRGISS